jgi:MoaA/NifB/PqqE/SkfB family radical SAM enzyme
VDCELKTFCVLPWIHSFVNSNGAYQICCLSEEYHQGIPDIDGNFYNIQSRPSLTEVMNAPMMKELRLKMLKGEWSEVCTRCFETEKNGGCSRRNIENSAFKETISELVKKTQDDGEIDLGFKSLDYRLGNTCNLQCRMCSPFSSSSWIKDWNEIKGENEQLTVELKEYYKGFSWPENSCLLDELREKLDGVKRIHFAGGEPLLSSQMSLILRELITTGHAKRMVISYNSNITVLPKEVLELWKHFKEISILASVDGHGEVNEYIRYPSKWSVVNKNLLYLDEHARELNIGEIILSCTVQIYNALYIKDLFDYLEKFQNILPVLNLSNLYFPEYLSAQALPAKAKEIASERLQAVLRDREERNVAHSYLVDNIKQTISFINEKDRTDLLEKFKKMNSNFDKKKNVKLASVLPELNTYLINYYIDQIALKSKH